MSEITCYCFNVEKQRVIAAIEGGCSSLGEIKNLLGVTGNCARCQPDIELLLEFYLKFPKPPAAAD